MSTVFVSGHKNPDLDCTASAVAYAHLKNQTDPNNTYIPIRCGALNVQTREAFKKAVLPEPILYNSLQPTVGDIAIRDFPELDSQAPIFDALKAVHSSNISFVPVFDSAQDTQNSKQFIGSISINEISAYLTEQFNNERPIHNFKVSNFERVIPGRYLCRGEEAEFEAPIVAGAMPFVDYQEWFKNFNQKPLLIVGSREKILEHAVRAQFPAIIITGVDISSKKVLNVDVSAYKGSIYLSESDTAECIRLLRISVPISQIVNTSAPHIQVNESFDKAKKLLMASEYRGFPVFDGKKFVGVVTRRCFVEKPAKNIILVDHNEIHQSVPGANEACVLEILDHHRFAAERTNNPIYIASRPVGSTSTIVFQHFGIHNIEIPPKIATILQAGIISDTVNCKSPTTTVDDTTALGELARISKIDNNALAREMFSQLRALKKRDPSEVIEADFKTYTEYGLSVGIGQVEVTNLSEVRELTDPFGHALNAVVQSKSLDWSLLLITDVLKHNSILVSSHFDEGTKLLAYNPLGNNSFDLPNILSRKKQLLPEILRIVEELQHRN